MGVVPGTEFAPSSNDEQVDNAGWPGRLLSNMMNHNLKSDRWRYLTSSGCNHKGEIQPTGLLQE